MTEGCTRSDALVSVGMMQREPSWFAAKVQTGVGISYIKCALNE